MKRTKNKAQLTGQSSSSGVGDLFALSAAKKFLGGKYDAKRITIKGSDVESKTAIHYLNPRNQDALTIEAVADIYESIVVNGVSQEGIAVRKDGQYLVLDSSRRRFCCINGKVDFPLWVIDGEPSEQELLRLINDSQEVKRWSYPEHGEYLLKIAKLKGLSVEKLSVAELAENLGMGKESLRKRLESLNIVKALREVFVDYEGIPNSFYGKIAGCQRKLIKGNFDVESFARDLLGRLGVLDKSNSIKDQQLITLKIMEELVNEHIDVEKTPKWKEQLLGNFDQKDISAKRKVSKDGRKTIYELTRLPADKQKQIDEFMNQILTS